MKVLYSTILLIALLMFSNQVSAGAPTCQVTSSGSPYCSYNGKVDKLYVNNQNLILMYFDTPLDLEEPSSVGIEGVSDRNNAVVRISDNPTFADYFYSTALAAFSSNKTVSIQMREVSSGRLVVDRIWITND